MKAFSKNEFIGVFIIFLIVFAITFSGLQKAEMRARDAQRKSDVQEISDALQKFYSDFGFFPPEENGKIKMCKKENFDAVVNELKSLKKFDRNLFFGGLRGCEWGKDSFRDPLDDSYKPYLSTIPSDPKSGSGVSYLYFSNTRRFQIFTVLEAETEDDAYDRKVVSRKLSCGVKICSFGKSSGEIPLDISIEEYESLLEKKSGN